MEKQKLSNREFILSNIFSIILPIIFLCLVMFNLPYMNEFRNNFFQLNFADVIKFCVQMISVILGTIVSFLELFQFCKGLNQLNR